MYTVKVEVVQVYPQAYKTSLDSMQASEENDEWDRGLMM